MISVSINNLVKSSSVITLKKFFKENPGKALEINVNSTDINIVEVLILTVLGYLQYALYLDNKLFKGDLKQFLNNKEYNNDSVLEIILFNNNIEDL